MKKLIILLLMIYSKIYCLEDAERIELNFKISDIFVKDINVSRVIEIGKIFRYEDFQNETTESSIKTIVSGKCIREDNKFHIIANRVTVKDNQIVRCNWIDKILTGENEDDVDSFGVVSMGSVSFFDISIKFKSSHFKDH